MSHALLLPLALAPAPPYHVISALHESKVFAHYAGCDETKLSVEGFKACIRSKPAEELMSTVLSWTSPRWPYPGNDSMVDFVIRGYGDLLKNQGGGVQTMAAREDFPLAAPAFIWTPILDGTVTGVPEVPEDVIVRGDHNKVPMMAWTMRVGTPRGGEAWSGLSHPSRLPQAYPLMVLVQEEGLTFYAAAPVYAPWVTLPLDRTELASIIKKTFDYISDQRVQELIDLYIKAINNLPSDEAQAVEWIFHDRPYDHIWSEFMGGE